MRELARNRSIRHDGVMSDILHKIYIEFTVGAVWPYQALLVVFLSVVIHRLRRRDWRATWAGTRRSRARQHHGMRLGRRYRPASPASRKSSDPGCSSYCTIASTGRRAVDRCA